MLKHFSNEKLTPDQQALLFLAARNLLYHNVIGPKMHKSYSFDGRDHQIDPRLGEFDILINDRSCDSTVVYQGHAQNPSRVEYLRKENAKATEGILPDLTIYLDVTPEIGLARTRKNRGIVGKDFFDSKTLEFHEKIRAGYKSEVAHYRSLPQTDPQYNRIAEIDSHPPIEQVEEAVWSAITERVGYKLAKFPQKSN